MKTNRLHFAAALSILFLIFGSCAPINAQETPSVAPAPATASEKSNQPELDAASQEKLKVAAEKFNKSDFNGSLEILKELAASNPKITPPRLIHAQWFAQLKNEKAVLLCLETAAHEDANDPEAFLLLGEISFKRGELMAAELLLDRAESVLTAYKTNPDRQKVLAAKLLNTKHALYAARGDWDKAQGVLGQLQKLTGDSSELSQRIAYTFFQKKDDESARKWLDHSQQLAGEKGAPAAAVMAQYYISRGDVEKAKESLAQAEKTNPKSVFVLSLATNLALIDNNLDLAWSNAQKLLTEQPDNLQVLKTYANVAMFRNDYASAEQAFQKATIDAPADAEAQNGLALALCEQQDPEKKKRALQYAVANVQKQNNNREFLVTCGWCLYQNGQKDEAIKVLQQACADGRMSQTGAYYQAVILSDLNQKDNAKKLLDAALSNKKLFSKRPQAEALAKQLNEGK